MRFSRQGYWSGLPFPSPGDLPNPGIEPGSPALQADSLPTEQYKSQCKYHLLQCICNSGLPWWFSSKEAACNAGDEGLIPELGRSLGEENSNPLQYSCLGNPMDRGGWEATVLGVTRVGHDLRD